MSWADLFGSCPSCGVCVEPWDHDCPVATARLEDEIRASLLAQEGCGE